MACVQQHGHSRQRLAEYIAAHRLLFQDDLRGAVRIFHGMSPDGLGKGKRDACAAIARIHCGALHQSGTGNGEIRREVRIVKIHHQRAVHHVGIGQRCAAARKGEHLARIRRRGGRACK